MEFENEQIYCFIIKTIQKDRTYEHHRKLQNLTTKVLLILVTLLTNRYLFNIFSNFLRRYTLCFKDQLKRTCSQCRIIYKLIKLIIIVELFCCLLYRCIIFLVFVDTYVHIVKLPVGDEEMIIHTVSRSYKNYN